MSIDATPYHILPENSGEDWPYGFGMCCCGCGEKARVVDGVVQKFCRKYHGRWLLAKQRRESPSKLQKVKPSQQHQKKTRLNKFAIAKHLSSAFQVSRSEVSQALSDKDRGSPTASERERLFPHLSAPTVELKDRFKKAVVDAVELGSTTPKQPELFSSGEERERLSRQLAWIKANQRLLEAISRARDRADTTVKGAYIRNRERTDVEFRLLQRIRGRISAVLRGGVKNSSTVRLLGCTLPELRTHLEKQFKPGMSWLNYGEWHVDHIRPCASFDFSVPTSLAQCFNYTNLQPMWGTEDFRKNSRWEGKLVRRSKQG